MCVNSSKTGGRTNIKLGPFVLHSGVSVIRGLMTLPLNIFLNSSFLTEESGFILKQKPSPDFPTFRNFINLGGKMHHT